MGSRKVTTASDWQGKHITVAGLGVSGISAARALAGLGARVTVVDGGSGAAH
ncbi:UDP-N-acetylmuramoyl-L-alanine--D-glutamate ligase, partial [Streptomyces sp. NPDC005904]